MAKGKSVWSAYWEVDEEERKSAHTIEIQLKDGRVVEVDDEGNWYADDEADFQTVIPTAQRWPGDRYYPLAMLRAYDHATWVAKEIGATVVTPKPIYKPEAYKVPPGAHA